LHSLTPQWGMNKEIDLIPRLLGLIVCALALSSYSSPVGSSDEPAADEQLHSGIFVSAKGSEFTMEVQGKEHSHTLAGDGKVVDSDGKEIKLEDLMKGDRIKVTTKEGDSKIALRVEVVKK